MRQGPPRGREGNGMRIWIRIGVALAAALALAPSALAATPAVDEFGTGIETGDAPVGITAGPDGNLWFTNNASDEIGRITPGGAITEFGLSSPSAFPLEIVGGADGRLWFTEFGDNKIGRINTSGTIENEFAIPTTNSQPKGITIGPSNILWFTESNADQIGRMTTGGVFNEFALPAGSDPADIAYGSDGNFFVTEPGTNRIAELTPAGVVTQIDSGLTAGAQPESITAGPDGNLWFTEPGADRIGRMSPSGLVTEFTLPGGSDPQAIVSAVDGKLWFTEPGTNKIGRIDSTGLNNAAIQASITHFDAGLSAAASPQGITAGPDGNLWFAERDIDRIGRINTATDPPQFQSPGSIDINGLTANQGALPYPATINVSGLAGTVTNVALRITGFSHTYPDDVDVLLVAPSGQTLRAMSDAGGGGATPADEIGTAVNGVSLDIVDDFPGTSIPDVGPLVSGRFNPGQGIGGVTFPAPAPAGPYGTALSTFDSIDPNGTWSLYVNDDASVDSGRISGWGLDFQLTGVANDDIGAPRPEDAAATLINVLSNDTGAPLEIVSVSDPPNGTATIFQGSPDEISYVADPDYCNEPGPAPPDTFTYEIPSGDTATVSFVVNCSPDASVANDDSRTVAEDSGATALTVLDNDTDVDDEPIDITAAGDPANGTATVIQGSPDVVSYAPDANYCNDAAPADTFTYTVGGGDTATVSVAVTCVEEPPPPPPPPNQPAPQTTITKAPKKLKAKGRKKAKATFEFSSSIAGATFACALDGAAPTPCSSPKTLQVKKGKHTFTVVATAAGVSDPTPASSSFKVKKKKRK